MNVRCFGPAACPSAIKARPRDPRLRVLFFDGVVRLEGLHGLFILPPGLKQEPGGNQVGVGPAARQCHLLADRRHRVPAIEHMRDLMPGEALEVFRLEPIPISHLHPIRPAFRELPQELVQVGDEVAAMLVVCRPEPRELEHEQPNIGTHGLARLDKRLHEQFGVEEILIGLTGLPAEPVSGELLNLAQKLWFPSVTANKQPIGAARNPRLRRTPLFVKLFRAVSIEGEGRFSTLAFIHEKSAA